MSYPAEVVEAVARWAQSNALLYASGADYRLIQTDAIALLDQIAPKLVAGEREECAKVADDHTPEKHSGMTLASHVTGRTIAAAIRAMGRK